MGGNAVNQTMDPNPAVKASILKVTLLFKDDGTDVKSHFLSAEHRGFWIIKSLICFLQIKTTLVRQ